MKKINPNLTLLDVGAGPGTISIAFAELIPDGQVTATDLDEAILQRAKAVADVHGVANIEFQLADAYKLPFADNSFDITHCHQVLTHLGMPWEVLREMLRVTKHGGVVAARESDLKTQCFWPELPGLIKCHDVMLKKPRGGSATAGRQLLTWALEAGAERRQITASYGAWCYSTTEDKKTWALAMTERVRGGRIRKIGLESGLLTENDLDEMAKAWDEWKERDDANLGMMHGEILIQK
ncbi:MAG: hypothetical protein Q9227_009480 [Pyrenula ochraceoflavens]